MTKPIRLAINGLGRVGRVFLRIAWGNPRFEIVAANSRSDLATYAHLLKYDSVYRIWDHDVKAVGDNLVIDGKKIRFFQGSESEALPWGKLGLDIVMDATGKYRNKKEARVHLDAGARYIVVSAPMDDPDKTLVMGVNEKTFDPVKDKVISAASCTSVCSILTASVLEKNFGITHGFVNTVHGFTNDQSLHDSSHKDLRRARAATQSIIPTTTGMSKTFSKIFPQLTNKIAGQALRVPVIDPSILSFSAELKTQVTAKAVNQAFVKAAKTNLKGHLGVSDLPLVSNDYIGSPYGATIDLLSTEVVDKNFVNVLAWYDNEWGYVSRLHALIEYLAGQIK